MTKVEYFLKGYLTEHTYRKGESSLHSHELFIRSPKGLCVRLGSWGFFSLVESDEFERMRDTNAEYCFDLDKALDIINASRFEKALSEGSSYDFKEGTIEETIRYSFKDIIRDLDHGLIHPKFGEKFYTCTFDLQEVDGDKLYYSSSTNNNFMTMAFNTNFEEYRYLTHTRYAQAVPGICFVEAGGITGERFETLEEVADKVKNMTVKINELKPTNGFKAVSKSNGHIGLTFNIYFGEEEKNETIIS